VLEDLLDETFVADVRAAYDAQLERHIALKGGMDGMNKRSFGTNHIGMFLPMVEPFSSPRLIAHPIVVQVLERVIGPDFRCSFYHSNTSYPGSGMQPLHRDNQPLFGVEMGVPHPPVAIVVNVPLCDFTEENGSTEVWPGTHLIVDDRPEQAKELEARVEALASTRTNVRSGSMVLRDLRLWHRGMPNNASYPRTMLAPVYTRAFLHAATQCEIPRETWEAWPERVRHIFRGNPIVEAAPELAGVTIGDLADQGKLRR
jgi:ectoine hydroxylase-related dioxygenase (phytanoyl-CoA dioxygenase family)